MLHEHLECWAHWACGPNRDILCRKDDSRLHQGAQVLPGMDTHAEPNPAMPAFQGGAAIQPHFRCTSGTPGWGYPAACEHARGVVGAQRLDVGCAGQLSLAQRHQGGGHTDKSNIGKDGPLGLAPEGWVWGTHILPVQPPVAQTGTLAHIWEYCHRDTMREIRVTQWGAED